MIAMLIPADFLKFIGIFNYEIYLLTNYSQPTITQLIPSWVVTITPTIKISWEPMVIVETRENSFWVNSNLLKEFWSCFQNSEICSRTWNQYNNIDIMNSSIKSYTNLINSNSDWNDLHSLNYCESSLTINKNTDAEITRWK